MESAWKYLKSAWKLAFHGVLQASSSRLYTCHSVGGQSFKTNVASSIGSVLIYLLTDDSTFGCCRQAAGFQLGEDDEE